MLSNASVTEALANFATNLIHSSGYWGIFGLTLCSAFFILPGTEVTMLFAGFNVYNHHLTMFGVVAAASIADIIGAVCVYFISGWGVMKLLNKLPGPFNIAEHGTERAEAWFERWGMPAVALTRIAPTVRAGGPWAAGLLKMNFWKYFVAMSVGTIAWMLGLAEIGKAVGSQWPKWKAHLDYVDYAIVVIVIALVAWFLYARIYKPRVAARTQTGVDG
jgi:membrane protein DedA with SNARE-associated domain